MGLPLVGCCCCWLPLGSGGLDAHARGGTHVPTPPADVAGRCVCEAAWSGEHCSMLNLLPATKGHGYRNTSAAGLRVSSWGGGVIWDEQSRLWNMFAAEFEEGCGL